MKMKKKKWFTGILLACVIALGTLYPCMSVSAAEFKVITAEEYLEGYDARVDKVQKLDFLNQTLHSIIDNYYEEAATTGVDEAKCQEYVEKYKFMLFTKVEPAWCDAFEAIVNEELVLYNWLWEEDPEYYATLTAYHDALLSYWKPVEADYNRLWEVGLNILDGKENPFVVVERVVADDEDDEEPEVVASSGEAISTTIPTSNTSDTTVVLTTPAGELNASAALEDGNYITLSVEGYVGDEAKKALNNAAQSAGGTVSRYLDISLNKWTPNGASNGKVTQLNAAVEIVVGAPEGVDANAFDFAVLRIHDGAVTILPDLDNDPETITFATDQFSAYAVIYGEKGSFDKYKTSKLSTKDNVPKTGDPFPVAVPAAVVLGVLMGALTLRYGKRI